MKRTRRGLFVALLAVAAAGLAPPANRPAAPARGEAEAATPRERIASYLLIYYVSDPNNANPRYRPQLLDPKDLLAGRETADFWNDPDIPGLQDLVRGLVMEPTDPDTRRFQAAVADLLDVRGKRVAVYLIDDAGHPLRDDGKVAEERYAASVDGDGTGVWPSSQDDEALSLTGEELAGSFSTGEVNLSSVSYARSTFVHELTHVQALSDGQPHLYFVGGVSFSYGEDGSHASNELLPNLSMVYDEAVANAMEMLYDPGQVHEAFDWLTDGAVVVERTRPDAKKAAATDLMPDVWLFDELKAAGAREFPATSRGGPQYAQFGMEDFPGRYLLHNETAMAVVLAESARRTVGRRGLLRALYRTNQVVKRARKSTTRQNRVSQQELASLLTELGEEILGGTDPTTALVSGGPMDHLLPLAYLDYMIGRDAATKEAFADLFGGQLDPAWLQVYWEVGRPRLDEILPAVTQIPRTFADLDTIQAAFAEGADGG